MGVGCDVTDEDQVVAAISKATERFGGVDILVNGAALFNFKGVLNMPVQGNRVFNIYDMNWLIAF